MWGTILLFTSTSEKACKGFKNCINLLGKRNSRKLEKGKGGASRPRPRFWHAGRSRPSPPTRLPLPAPASTRGRLRRDAVASRQSSAAAWRACAGVDAPWSATRCARPRPPPPPLPVVPLRSLSHPLPRPRAAATRATPRHCHRHSELLSPAASASSLNFSAANDFASPSRTPRARSIAFGKLSAPVRAHRSESELRRPLGSRCSPYALHHCLRF